MSSKPSLLARLLGQRPHDPDTAPPLRKGPEGVRPLWHRLVAIAREKPWYAQMGIADTLPGRFDAVTLVLCVALLRMEGNPALNLPLRESGVGDLVVGKHIGKLMSVLGGRLGAYRAALAASDDSELVAAITRNVTLTSRADPALIASAVRDLATALASLTPEALLAGEID